MRWYHRAIKYVIAQKGKSFLLGCILFIAFSLCLSGMAMLRMSDQKLTMVAKHSKVNIGLFMDGFHNDILEVDIQMIQKLDNITFINRGNRLDVTINQYINIGQKEPMFGLETVLGGLDDFTLDGSFYTKSAQIIKGDLQLSGNQILVEEGIVQANKWDIGTAISFKSLDGIIKEGVIAGIYRTNRVNTGKDDSQIYTTPAFINELQGKSAYTSVAFYVGNPNTVQDTQQEIKDIMNTATFMVSISDSTYQKLKTPLETIKQMIQITLAVTFMISVIIVTLLLSLAIRERRKETALLLSMGETKTSIMLQRIAEICIIISIIFICVIPLNIVVFPVVGKSVFSATSSEIDSFRFSLTGKDILQTAAIGLFVIFLTIFLSILPLIKLKPRHALSTID